MTILTIARQRFCKRISEVTQSTLGPPLLGSRSLGTFRSNGKNINNNRVIHELFEVAVSRRFAPSYKREGIRESNTWKSQMWDSKIWSQVPRDSDPRKTALARTSSIYKGQTRPVVREGAPQDQDRNCHTCNKDLVVSPRWVLCSKTDWPADRRS
jgi:hypothetical protein